LDRFENALVLALPRGGVPVAFEVAGALGAPLDLFLVRKVGLPRAPEVAMGAIASGGLRDVDTELMRRFGVPMRDFEEIAAREAMELARRERAYRGERPPAEVRGKDVIVVDDGIATGASMRVALRALRRAGPRTLVAAAPVGAVDACESLREEADRVVCLETPEPFSAVSLSYVEFSPTSDEEVRSLLRLGDSSATLR
jgi:predicted phosphoribosyltransferase